MPKVGIRELKNDTSAIIRAVREENAEYIVTYRGEAVAILSPLGSDQGESTFSDSYGELRARLDALAEEIAAQWKSEKSGIELVSEQRR